MIKFDLWITFSRFIEFMSIDWKGKINAEFRFLSISFEKKNEENHVNNGNRVWQVPHCQRSKWTTQHRTWWFIGDRRFTKRQMNYCLLMKFCTLEAPVRIAFPNLNEKYSINVKKNLCSWNIKRNLQMLTEPDEKHQTDLDRQQSVRHEIDISSETMIFHENRRSKSVVKARRSTK